MNVSPQLAREADRLRRLAQALSCSRSIAHAGGCAPGASSAGLGGTTARLRRALVEAFLAIGSAICGEFATAGRTLANLDLNGLDRASLQKLLHEGLRMSPRIASGRGTDGARPCGRFSPMPAMT